MGQALYRKYRSKSLDEIVGQDHITHTLKKAVESGKISHAYLFTGPRGVGKTSIARILAHAINGLDYSDNTQNHLDIIEIDAASNRRIDEIRDLRDKVHVAPTSAKYKVYIIDEVHMLTKEAFNALLKTLEEPPKHVVFILATTEAHKLPETIISRTQRFAFKPIDPAHAVTHLKQLAKQEKIAIDDDALELIAEHGGGSFRDSISLLDQLSSGETIITSEEVHAMLGAPPAQAVATLLEYVRSGDSVAVMEQLTAMREQGYQPHLIAKQISKHLRHDINALDTSLLGLMKLLIEVPTSHEPLAYLELCLLEATFAHQTAAAPVPVAKPTAHVPATPPRAPSAPSTPAPSLTPKPASSYNLSQLLADKLWQKTLEALKGQYNTLYGIARMAQPRAEQTELVLAFSFPFHQRRCNEPRNLQRITAVIKNISGYSIPVSCLLDKTAQPPKVKQTTPAARPTAKPVKSDTLDSITEIFGGGEVMD